MTDVIAMFLVGLAIGLFIGTVMLCGFIISFIRERKKQEEAQRLIEAMNDKRDVII